MKNSVILKIKTYPAFRKALSESGCNACTLSKSRSSIVVDRGNPQSRIVLIGEAPGREEDLKGYSFVGRSGRLLDSVLEELGYVTNDDCLLMSIAKCRPPENRVPTQQEAETCLPYLKKQLHLARPKVIGLLGATAFKYMLPERKKEPVTSVVGKLFKDAHYPETRLMVLFHPAYILRNPSKRSVMKAHLKKLMTAI
ncbi:MAG: uracil-DNA glycosylase [Candidatus Omnitrophica bacterium]|nr:uracil-DNA glycosylase [Candidatus Omnitrophota bacterium]